VRFLLSSVFFFLSVSLSSNVSVLFKVVMYNYAKLIPLTYKVPRAL
jgi:hypothetical protein